MTFPTWPIAAVVGAVVVPALIILYFLKLRRRDVEVSSTLLWKKAIQDLQANAPFQKLRNNILLILQLIVLAAALFALASPEMSSRGQTTDRHIIMIDRSASMSASDGAADPAGAAATVAAPGEAGRLTRLEAAKKQAIEFVDALREPGVLSIDSRAEEAMIIAFDSNAAVVQSFTSSKSLLREAIRAIEPSDAPTELTGAYELAKAYTGTKKFEDQVQEGVKGDRPRGFIPSGPEATIHIYSDGRLPDADRVQTRPEDRVKYHAIGSKDAVNIAITGVRAERSFDNPGRVNVFVGLQSTDTKPRAVDLELNIDGQLANLRGVSIAAATAPTGVDAGAEGEEATAKTDVKPGVGGFVFPLDRPEGGLATVRILPGDDDALAADNTAYAAIPPAKRLSVALVTDGKYFFIQDALSGLNLSKFDVLTPAAFQERLDKDQVGEYDVFVLDRVLPQVKVAAGSASAAAAGATSNAAGAGDPGGAGGPPPAVPAAAPTRGTGLPLGRSLVLGVVPPPPLGAVDGGAGEADVIVDYVRDHPALKFSNLDKINIAEARKVTVRDGDPVRVLARVKQGPAILEVTDPAATALVVTFDPGAGDWPFDVGFVAFMADAIMHLSQTQGATAGQTLRPGDTLVTRLPGGVSSVTMRTPSGDRKTIDAAPDGTVSYGPLERTGVYTLTWDGPAGSTDVLVNGAPVRPITVNLVDPAESDLGTRPSLAMAREVVDAEKDRTGLLTRRLWPYAILAALGVVMLEWWVYNRKVAV